MKKYFIGTMAITIGIIASSYVQGRIEQFDCGSASDYWFIVPGGSSPTSLSGAISAVGTGSSGTPYTLTGTQNTFDATGACGNQGSIVVCAFSVPSAKVSYQNGDYRLNTGTVDSDINCFERRHLPD